VIADCEIDDLAVPGDVTNLRRLDPPVRKRLGPLSSYVMQGASHDLDPRRIRHFPTSSPDLKPRLRFAGGQDRAGRARGRWAVGTGAAAATRTTTAISSISRLTAGGIYSVRLSHWLNTVDRSWYCSPLPNKHSTNSQPSNSKPHTDRSQWPPFLPNPMPSVKLVFTVATRPISWPIS
jgi:hypothetical protein